VLIVRVRNTYLRAFQPIEHGADLEVSHGSKSQALMSQTQPNCRKFTRNHQLMHQCINPHYNSNNSGSTPIFS